MGAPGASSTWIAIYRNSLRRPPDARGAQVRASALTTSVAQGAK